MLVRDVRSGRLVAVPDSRFYAQATAPLGYYGEHGLHGAPLGSYAAAPQQPLYDGLGNPLGLPFLAALAPLASSLLPMIAKGASSVLPSLISNVLPMITGGGSPSPPALPMTPAPAPPAPLPIEPPLAPMPMPMPMTRRRSRPDRRTKSWHQCEWSVPTDRASWCRSACAAAAVHGG